MLIDVFFALLYMEDLHLDCPWCGLKFAVYSKDINCGIFRHGAINGEPLAPHASQNECENALKQPGVIGCCKPLKIIKKNDNYEAIQCGYE